VKSYGQFCPVAQAMELLGERWTLLVVRELLAGSTRFSEIERGVPTMSRTLLSQRLATLVDAGVVERRPLPGARGHGYHLTDAGEGLRPIVEACGVWAVRWLRRDLRREELDAGLLMWDVQRNLVSEQLPDEPVLVHFHFPDGGRGKTRFWLRITRGEVDLCLTHPGFEVDLEVEASVRAMTQVWLGRRTLDEAVRAGDVRLSGDPRFVRSLSSWLRLSDFAPAARALQTAAVRRVDEGGSWA